MRLTKYSIENEEEVQLPFAPQYRSSFALCIVKGRFVLLSGGYDESGKISGEVFLFDTQSNEWVTSRQYPDLSTARTEHASCASSMFAFVFGGYSKGNLDSLEFVAIE